MMIDDILVSADSAREALVDLDVADVLTFQLKRAPDAERRHVILEILGSLGESGKKWGGLFQGGGQDA